MLGSQEDCLAVYEPWNEERAAEIIAAHANQEGPALPILHALQHAFGCVPTDAVPMVAKALNLTRAEVHGIVTFYHEFRRTPPGRHQLHLCRAEACQAMGADAVAAGVKARLRVDWHGTTEDGGVTLEPVFCLGLCAIGPAALLDGNPLARLNTDKVAAALDAVQ
jgi:formate dehydrogenase subunit gamma